MAMVLAESPSVITCGLDMDEVKVTATSWQGLITRKVKVSLLFTPELDAVTRTI